MNVILKVRLVAYGKPIQEADGTEIYINLNKEIDLPFAPFPSLDIFLSCIQSNHPDAKRYRELLKVVPEPVTGIFRVERVQYLVQRETFWVDVNYLYECYESIEATEMLAEQMVIGYGFMRDDV